jgi:hypothetical protein
MIKTAFGDVRSKSALYEVTSVEQTDEKFDVTIKQSNRTTRVVEFEVNVLMNKAGVPMIRVKETGPGGPVFCAPGGLSARKIMRRCERRAPRGSLPPMNLQRFAPLTIASLLLAAGGVGAQPNPWPFDFDPALAARPDAVEDGLQTLGQGLPGLPAALAHIGVAQAEVDLWFFPEAAAGLERLRFAGPETEPVARNAQLCAVSQGLLVPADLLTDGSGACVSAEAALHAALADAPRACVEVEFPETYVTRHPAGQVDSGVVSTLEGLIALAGEALSHHAPPVGMLPSGFFDTTRSIITKIRHDTLNAQLAAQHSDLEEALATLSAEAACFRDEPRLALHAQLQVMLTESEAARAHNDAVQTAGLAQAQRDRAAVEQHGRLRGDLPVPALTDGEREFLGFWLGGVYWRMRGGGLVDEPAGTQQTRLFYLLAPFRRIGDVAGGADGVDAGNDIFLRIFDGWGEWMDMGRTAGQDDKYYDLVFMTDRGKRQVEFAADRLSDKGYESAPLIAGGLAMGACYFDAWEELGGFSWLPSLPLPYTNFLEGPTAIGEFCTGATIGLGLARTLLWGKPNTSCVTSCDGKACGFNGCGGSCGSCGTDEACELGVCVCSECGGEEPAEGEGEGEGEPAEGEGEPAEGEGEPAEGEGEPAEGEGEPAEGEGEGEGEPAEGEGEPAQGEGEGSPVVPDEQGDKVDGEQGCDSTGSTTPPLALGALWTLRAWRRQRARDCPSSQSAA